MTRFILLLTCFSVGCATLQRPPATPQREAAPLTQSQLIEVASALDQRGDLVRAEQYWTLALAQGAQPKHVLPPLMAACLRDRQYRLALQYGNDQLRRHPNDDKLRLLTGTLHEAVGDYPAAVEQYQAVLQQQPTRADVHYLLAQALQKGGAHAQADLHYRKYIELEPNGAYAERAQASLLKEMTQ